MGDGALNAEAWFEELPLDDPEREWLLKGIFEGFSILDETRAHNITEYVEIANYKSATGENKLAVESQIIEEISNNRYVVVYEKPRIVSALGAIPKSNNKVRLIHDASRPVGTALNDLWEKEKFSYCGMQDAIDLIKPGYYLAKADCSNAYRSVKIHPSNYTYTGLKWNFEGECHPKYLIDTRLPFGARRSPFIFNHLTQAVCRMMRARGFGVVAYLDDFLLVESTHAQCLLAQNTLLTLLRRLGFAINYGKVEGPCTSLSFLGLTLNSVSMKIELPHAKMHELQCLLKDIESKAKTTKKELQKLAGKLNFATQAIYGGKFFLRRLHDAIARLEKPWHRTRITKAIKADCNWWINFMAQFNGTVDMVDSRPASPVFTDACPIACGAVYENEFVYLPWSHWPESSDLHINFQETLAIEVALTYFAEKLRNRKVILHCDNMAAVGIVNRGSSREAVVMSSLRRLFWLSAVYNFRIYATYFPGEENRVADAISRLHEGPRLLNALQLYPVCFRDIGQSQDRGHIGPPDQTVSGPHICRIDEKSLHTPKEAVPTILPKNELQPSARD